MIAGTAIMTLVITGGLVALDLTTRFPDKITEQVKSDFILRQEVEALRSMDWVEIETRHDTILAYEKTRAGDYTIVGPTVLVIDGDFDIGDNTIDIAPTGSQGLYVSGDSTVNDKSVVNNMGTPANLQAYLTHPMVDPSASLLGNWTLSANGALAGLAYGPSVEYRINGGGYNMDKYELRENGDLTHSEDAKAVFDSKDYAALFQELYP